MTLEQYRSAFVAHPLMVLLAISVVVRLLTFVALAHRGLATRYLGLSAYLLAGCIRSILLLAWGYSAPGGYGVMWNASAWVPHLLFALLAIDGIRLMSDHFKNYRRFAAFVGALSLTVGIAIAWVMSGVATPTWGSWVLGKIETTRNATLILVLALALTRIWFYSSPSTVMRHNVRRFVDVTLMLFLAEWIAFFSMRGMGNVYHFPINVFITLLPVGASFGWLSLKPNGEKWMPPPPATKEDEAAEAKVLETIGRSFRAKASGD